MGKVCALCGFELDKIDTYCPECGTDYEDEIAEEAKL
jgi:hypothetical protein